MQNLNGSKDEIQKLNGTVAYCSQIPWIMSGPLKDNILFGKEYKKDKYNKIIKSCALELDLEQLTAGDMTELGERGINLSGIIFQGIKNYF